MPDGAPGVLWRGVRYPLRDGNRIDVAVPATDHSAAGVPAGHAILNGDGSSWLLLQGPRTSLVEAEAALRHAGVSVVRSGRWLGEPVGDQVFDWFIRCDGALAAETAAGALSRAPALTTPMESDPATTIAHLQRRVADLSLELELLRVQTVAPGVLARPESQTVVTESDLSPSAPFVGVEQPATGVAEPRSRSTGPSRRMHDEVDIILQVFCPHVVLLRNSVRIASGEFASRAAFYRALTELPVDGGRPSGNQWKTLQGAVKWLERHVSSGQDDTGRLYARFDSVARNWRLLLGWKGEQPHDIAWLSCHS